MQRLNKLEIRGRIETIQTIVVVKSAKLRRNIVQISRRRCHSNVKSQCEKVFSSKMLTCYLKGFSVNIRKWKLNKTYSVRTVLHYKLSNFDCYQDCVVNRISKWDLLIRPGNNKTWRIVWNFDILIKIFDRFRFIFRQLTTSNLTRILCLILKPL